MQGTRKYPWGHPRRFNAYPEYFKKIFGERVQKLSIDAGFTCPNRDGSKGSGGCTFCNNNAFNPSYCTPSKSIDQQIEEGIHFHQRRYRKTTRFLAYFQAYSNTYDSLDVIRSRYEEALMRPEVIGLVIGTRPDTVDPAVLDHIQNLSQHHYIIIEYGVESCYNSTLERINRGHTFEDSVRAIEMTAERGIRQGAHFIVGLPGETAEEFLAGIDIISAFPIQNIKFHQLQIVRNTIMAKQFQADPTQFQQYGLEEYLDLMVEVLEVLNPHFVVERIAGEVQPGYLLGDSWNLRYDRVLEMFEDILNQRDTWQGRRYRGGNK